MLVQSIDRFRVIQNNTENQQQTNQKNNVVPFCSTTSAGQPLRKLKGAPCPYFGITMISSSEINKIIQDLVSCTTVKKAVKYLKKYEPNMQKIEKAIFERFSSAAKDSPRMQFPALLKKWYNEALIKLKLEEFAVIDDIDKISLSLSPESTLNVRKETTNCRQVILADDPFNRFKRKTVLDSLGKLEIKPGEERIFETLMDSANYLPTSATSENAFIVKYAERSHNEIAKRLVLASVATIEHVLPDSKGGENSMDNFLLTSANANNLRQNMPLKKFIKMFPQIPENCQKYIDYIIDRIHLGGLKGNQTYPYDIKKTLLRQSNGKIKLDLSRYKFSKAEAKQLEKESLQGGYKHKKKTRKRG